MGNIFSAENPFEGIEEQFANNPLKAYLVIEAIQSENSSSEDGGAQETGSVGSEQFMKISIPFPTSVGEVFKIGSDQTHLILVADRSGSMSGNPWTQVKQAMAEIVQNGIDDPRVHIDIVLYDNHAETVMFDARNFHSVIDKLSIGGSTSFVAAFSKVDEVIAANRGMNFSRVVVMFLTDGQDTACGGRNKLLQEAAKWKNRVQALDTDVCVHTVGFSRSHDFQFLQELSTTGTMEGLFRYCEPEDGPSALKAKLEELFNFISFSSGQCVNIETVMDGENMLVGLGKVEQSSVIHGEVIEEENDSEETGASVTPTKQLAVKAESWIYLPDATCIPKPTFHIAKSVRHNKQTYVLKFPVVVQSAERQVLTEPSDKAEWYLRILSRNTDILTTKFADIIANKGSASKLEARLKKLQDRVSQTNVFGKGISKEQRTMTLEFIKEIQKKIDVMHGMLARYVRGETQSVSMLARAHDLRYEAQFSKSRRQRLMDKRATKNIHRAKEDQEKLKNLKVNSDELNQLSEDALYFFLCVLSQNNVKDILMNSDSEEDAIGFGLAIKRPEHALDEPTATRISLISGTLVSRNFMFDALEYKISVEGHLSAHGGFNFNDPLGCATVGLSREPINAWLPLYITKSHWERVKVLMKPTLGYFCTLDPLGYNYKQMDCLFMVLGSMIGQLNDATVGEHQLHMLFAFKRTCAACISDFELLSQITDLVKNFISGPEGRTKDIIPNLYTLIGYIVALPTSITRPLLGYKGDKKELPAKTCHFWMGFTAECLRRAAGSVYRESNEKILNGLIDVLLHGKHKSSLHQGNTSQEGTTVLTSAKAQLVHQCGILKFANKKDVKMDINEFDPAAGIQAPVVKLKRSAKVDKAMDLWAQVQCEVITNKNQADQLTAAKKIVQQWEADGIKMACGNSAKQTSVTSEDGAVGGEAETLICEGETIVTGGNERQQNIQKDDTSKEEDFDIDQIDSSVLETTAMLLEKLTRSCFPELAAIPGCIVFVDHWLRNQLSYQEMDKNSGLPPQAWIDGVKQAIHKIFTNINGFVSACEAEVQAMQNSDSDTLVVIATDSGITSTSHDDVSESRKLDPNNKDADGNHGDEEQDENYSDNTEDYYYDTEEETEDNPETVIRKRKEQTRCRVTLPMILHVLAPSADHMTMVRAALCQAVEFHSNSHARTGAKGGQLKDLGVEGHDRQTLCELHKILKLRREAVLQGMINQALWQRANYSMLHADTLWAFVGYLMHTHTDRGEGFSELISQICTLEKPDAIPLLTEKLKILLLGKYQDCSVIANGNMWLPEKKMAQKFEAVIGRDAWTALDLDLRSNIQIHVYRESDIPNRHGHCNSNPYIPNVLRKKLGMPLLPTSTKAVKKASSSHIRSKMTR